MTPTMELQLTGSVGKNGDNGTTDVLLIQTLLGVILAAEKRSIPWLLSPGQNSPGLEQEILRFQRANTSSRDSKIDRGGATWRALIAKVKRLGGGILPQPPSPGPNPSTGKILRPIGAQDWMFWSPPGQLLGHPAMLNRNWDISFGGLPLRGMDGVAFLCPGNVKLKALGLAVPKECKLPKAYVIYFRHTAQVQDYPTMDAVIKLGIGDHMIGRTQLLNQLSASGKDVAIVLPMGVGGLHEFTNDEAFIKQCLQEIDEIITGTQRELPPIAVACYSDGIGELGKFLKNCPGLASKIVAAYDMDGALVTRHRDVTLNIPGAQVFRYVGASSPPRRPREDDTAYLARTMTGSPMFIPLPKSRWKNHPNFREHRNGETWWLHHFIPSCMLQHGLTMTTAF